MALVVLSQDPLCDPSVGLDHAVQEVGKGQGDRGGRCGGEDREHWLDDQAVPVPIIGCQRQKEVGQQVRHQARQGELLLEEVQALEDKVGGQLEDGETVVASDQAGQSYQPGLAV